MTGDTTCFSEFQKDWGTKREKYAPIVFEYLPPNNPAADKVEYLRFDGKLVIDYWLAPGSYFSESSFPNTTMFRVMKHVLEQGSC